MDKLPPDLRQYVKDDNEVFEKEVKEWDILQALKAQSENPLAGAFATCSMVTSPDSLQPMSIKSSPAEPHAHGKHLLLHLVQTLCHQKHQQTPGC